MAFLKTLFCLSDMNYQCVNYAQKCHTQTAVLYQSDLSIAKPQAKCCKSKGFGGKTKSVL